MNDFAIQGITILGTEVVSYATWGIIIGFIFSCVVILAGILGFFGCLKYGDASLIPPCTHSIRSRHNGYEDKLGRMAQIS